MTGCTDEERDSGSRLSSLGLAEKIDNSDQHSTLTSLTSAHTHVSGYQLQIYFLLSSKQFIIISFEWGAACVRGVASHTDLQDFLGLGSFVI